MRYSQRLRSCWLFAAVTAMTACGGGGGGGSGGPGGAAPPQAVIASGTVTGFGSVVVGGARFETSPGTAVSLDGSSGSVADLKLGMVVVVTGHTDGVRLIADSIESDSEVEGPVTSVDGLPAGTLEVLGQTVLLDDLTVFEGTRATGLGVGDVVEVSGLWGGGGGIRARRVELKLTRAQFEAQPPSARRVEVEGTLAADPAEGTFSLGNLTVSYTTPTLAPAIVAAGGLRGGMRVEVVGNMPLTGNVLPATAIALETSGVGAGAAVASLRVEGLVTRFGSPASFDVEGQAVEATGARFENGVIGDLAPNARVRVEGKVRADGTVAAEEVTFLLARNIRIEGDVAAVDPAAGTLRVFGASPGLQVRVDGSTVQQGDGIAGLTVGDRVSLRASLRSGELICARLEGGPPSTSPVRLQGPVDADSIAEASFSVLGVPVTTSDLATRFEGEDGRLLQNQAEFFAFLNGAPVAPDGFLAEVFVKVTGALDAQGRIEAREIELETRLPSELEHRYEEEGAGSNPFEFEYETETDEDGEHGGTLPPPSSDLVVLAWNDLGMHCLNPSYDTAVILPPYNTVWAQVVRRGNPPEVVTQGIRVEYRLVGNTASASKASYGQFWEFLPWLFGVTLAPDTGLNLVQPDLHNGLAGAMAPSGDHFEADGIPVVPVDDENRWNPYQVAEISVADPASGQILARTRATVPTSDEIRCDKCHGPNPFLDILRHHDESRPTLTLEAKKPVLCAGCHGSPALGAPLRAGIPYLSQAVHGFHAGAASPSCYDCHPGESTRCSRSRAHTASDGNCTNAMCHGPLANVGTSIGAGRTPWLDEPKCSACHATGVPEADTGTTLYRNARGHGGLSCPACHGSPHAMYPSLQASDNYQPLQYQGSEKTLGSCGACHESSRGHGLEEFPEHHGGTQPANRNACHVCHAAVPLEPTKWPHAYKWVAR